MFNVKLSSQRWTYGLILIIVTVYLALTVNWLVHNQLQQHRLQTTYDALPLLIPVQLLTQQLQEERGMLSGFATQQLPVRPPIELKQLQTDAAWRDLQVVIDSQSELKASANAILGHAPQPQQLYLLRQQVIEQQMNSTLVRQNYTELLQPFLDVAKYLQQQNEIAKLKRPLAALVALTQALELAGQERATLHVAFAQMQMHPSRYQSFVILVNEQMDYLQKFVSLSSPAMQQRWQVVLSQLENGAFIELREQALAQQFESDVQLWFALSTARIDRIYQLRYEMCQQLIQQVQAIDLQLRDTFQQLLTQLQLLLVIFLLLVWRFYRLYQGERSVHKPIRHSHQF